MVTLAGCGKPDGSPEEGVSPVDGLQENASREEESGGADEGLNSSTGTAAAVTGLEGEIRSS